MAIVDLGRSTAATVHRDVEAPTIGWFLAEDCVSKGHLQATELNTFLLELLASCLSQASHLVVDQEFLGGLGLLERQGLRRKRLIGQRPSNVDGALQIGFQVLERAGLRRLVRRWSIVCFEACFPIDQYASVRDGKVLLVFLSLGFELDAVLGPLLEIEMQVIVRIEGIVLGFSFGNELVRLIEHLQSCDQTLGTHRVEGAEGHHLGPFGNLQTDVGVAVGHVDRADVIDGTVPDHREFQRGTLETDRIDRMLQIVSFGR